MSLPNDISEVVKYVADRKMELAASNMFCFSNILNPTDKCNNHHPGRSGLQSYARNRTCLFIPDAAIDRYKFRIPEYL
jgi:hypothetical protein